MTALPVPVHRTPDGRQLILHSDGELLPFAPEFRCTAWKRDGSGRRCRNTAIRGGTVCESHGGSAPQVALAARRRVEAARVEADITRALADIEDDLRDRNPLFALREALVRAEARARAYSSLEAGEPLGPRALVLDQLVGQWLDRQARFAKLALDANLDERYARLSEAHGEVFARALRDGFTALFAHLRDELSARADFHGLFQGEPPGALDRLFEEARRRFIDAARVHLASQQQRSTHP